MPYRALVALTVFTLGLCAVAILLPPNPRPSPPRDNTRRPNPHVLSGQPAPAAWELRAWSESRCDRCRRNLTADPRDGLYIIGGEPYWLHGSCVGAVARATRR